MNSRSAFTLVFLTAAVAVAQTTTPPAGTVTAIPESARLSADGGVLADGGIAMTAVVGTNQHPGFCGAFGKQAENVDNQTNSVATAVDLIDNATPLVSPTRSQFARELVPVADLVNQSYSGGTHTPDVRMAWTTACTTYGGDLSGVRFAYRLRGNLNVTSAGTKTFMVNSDDGFSLRVAGTTVMEFNGNRGPASDTRRVSFSQPGVYPIELIYWEQGGNSTMELLMADSQVCFNGTTASATCNATNIDRSNTTILTAAQASAFTIMGSTQVGIPTWASDDNCASRVGTANTLCAPSGTAACGNAVIDALSPSGQEGCDDGNTTAGDGCSATCTVETNYVCSGTTSVCVPNAPAITAPAANAQLATTTPAISGTGIAGMTVTVREGATTVCTATVAAGGAWSCNATPALTQGSHTVTATQTDSGGRTSAASPGRTFFVDTVAPALPVVTAPASGATVNTGAVVFSGTSEPGATVRVFVDANTTTPVCTALVQPGGTWTCTYPGPGTIADGAHTVRASAVDAAGNASALTTAQPFTVDTVAPAAPVVSAPAVNASLNTTAPTVSGTAEANSTVTVLVDGAPYCSTTASAAGAFSCAGTTALSQGSHTISARATDAAGNTGPASTPYNVNVDTVPPAAPVVVTPANGSSLSNATPTLSGTGEVGSTVRVFLDGSSTAACTLTVPAGGAWSCTSPLLTNGSHTVRANASDAAGNVSSSSNVNTFSIDTVAPAAPVISAPTTGTATNNTTPTVSGTAEGSSTVTVFDGATLVCTTTASVAGAWSCTTTTLAPGGHSLTARATDAAGNVSPVSNTVALTVDTTAPVAPVISAPAQNAYVNTTTPTLSGTGEAGATVTVTIGGTTACTALVDASGNWSCVSSTLTQGAKVATATQRDTAGNVSPATANRNFTVDSVAPTTPTITTPAQNASTNDTTPTFTGTGEAGTTIAVNVAGVTGAVCTATVAAGGTWSCTPATALPVGARSATARSTDLAGNTADSAARAFTIDTTPPPAPVIAAPANDASLNTATPTISGTAEANSTVRVFDGANTTPLCTATANASGAWSCTSSALTEGAHPLTARATDAAGNVSPASTTVTVNVDTTAPVAPVVTAPAQNAFVSTVTPTFSGSGEPGATVSVVIGGTTVCTALVDASGAWSCVSSTLTEGSKVATITQRDPAGNTSPAVTRNFTVDTVAPSAPAITAPSEGLALSDATPDFSGTAEAGATVSVFVDGNTGTPVCTATAGPGGAWTCTPTTDLTEGAHTVTARARDAAGNDSPISTPAVNFSVDTSAPTAPAITTPADDAALSDTTPTISGNGEAGATVSVFDGSNTTPICTAVVGVSGMWSCTPGTALTEGPHTLTASQRDPAGNTSPVSGAIDITIDATAPVAVVITAPTANAALNDTTPEIRGTGEAGATVQVYFDGDTTTPACTATVAPDNSWSCSPTTALTGASHTVAATQTDAAGNASPRTAEVAFSLDTTAPTAPVITSPADDELLTSAPTVTGTAEAGSTVTVFADGSSTPVCTIVVPANGAWSCATTLADGAHTVTAISTDEAGNASTPATIDFSIDGVAPIAPVITAPTEGGTTASSTTFSGTAEAGSTVRVFIDGATTESCTVQANASGNWACVVNGLATGSHTATATAQDATGNTSPATAARNFQVAPNAPPGPPVIAVPAQNAALNDTTPTVSGQAALLSTVRVYVDGSTTPACTATTDASGNWSCDLAPALTEGAHSITATATVVGVVSLPSAPVGFVIDVTAPAAPTVTAPAANATVGAHPTISGSAEAGSTVSVYVDGGSTPVCTATANAAGTWVCAPSTALTDGAHTLVARATDAAGNMSPDSSPVAFTVDGSLPVSSPVITAPIADSFINDATPTVQGTAAPFATVNVYADGNTTTPVCTTTAAADGAFTCTLPTALGEGEHTLTATATDGNGTSAPSNGVDFTVDTVAPNAPVVSSPTAGESVSRTPTISGTAEAGSTVDVRIDGQLVCSVIADMTGAWSCTQMQPLPAGNHVVTATATDAAGNRSTPSADLSFTVTDMPTKPIITSPTANQMVDDTTPTITGTAQPNTSITVKVDGADYCTTTADMTGAWSCTGSGALSTGAHSVVATSTSAGGTSSSDAVAFTISNGQPMTPAAPVITSPNNGTVTFDNTPTFSGTAEAGTTVSVKVDGVEVCTTTATAQGTFSCTASRTLADGAHTVTATASRGTATSPASSSVGFTVNTAAPTVTSPTTGTTTGTNTTITGTATPGATVVVKVNGEEKCRATADEEGNWSCSAQLPAGETELVAEIEDGNGNSLAADPVSVRVVRGALTGGGIGAGCSSSPASASMWLAALVLGFLFSRRSSKAAAAVAAAVITTGAAQAQTQVAPFELERVRLNPGAADGLLQEGGKLMDPMSLRVSLLGHYQHNPLVVHEDGRPVAALVGSRWTAHLGAAFGITDWLEAGLQIPLVLSQTGNAEGTGYTPITNAVALGTPWLQLRAAPLRERSGSPFDLSFGVAVGFPFGSAASLTRENTVTAVPTVGIGKTLGSMFRIGGNVAVNIRPASALNDASPTQIGSYMTTGLVLSTTGKVLRGELSGRIDIPFTQSPAAGELYAGIRWAPHHLVELSLIGGPGFGTQPGTPAFRVLGGIAFTPSFKSDGAKPVAALNACVAGQAHDPKKCPELDLDGDGIRNAADKCVDKPGISQREGCPDVDTDGDGVLDLADKCVKVAGLRELDGCPEPDADKDGIADARDACPNAAGPASSNGCPDTDGDGFDDANDACVNDAGVAALRGCPDLDTDGDGVVDRLDNCVKEAGVAANQGCPAKQKQLVVITAEKLMILDKVYFATGKAAVLPKSDPLLKQVARVLNEHPDVKLVIVEGHTDNVGRADKNLALSQARADAVRTKLIGFGVAGERLEAKGYGDTKPLEDNKTPKGREANRRVEFVLGGQK